MKKDNYESTVDDGLLFLFGHFKECNLGLMYGNCGFEREMN